MNLITLGIILINVLVTYKGLSDYSFFNQYKFNIAAVKRGEYMRMFTSGFLHVDWQHLIFNMLSLYFFANIVILNMGISQFIILYCISLLLGNILSYLLYRKEGYYSAVGASGAVTGVIYAAILFYPKMTIFVLFIPMPAMVFAIGYLLYSIYGMRTRTDNIGHSAHFGGAIGGYVYVLAKYPQLINTQTWVVVSLAIPIIILFIMYYLKKI